MSKKIFLFLSGLILIVNAIRLPAQTTEPGIVKNEIQESAKSGLVYVIPIHGAMMDQGLPYFIKRSIESAKKEKAALIIFEIDTPGGAVDVTTEISTAILNASPITTVAYIVLKDNEGMGAISGGVLVSISCDKIIMQSGTAIGASEVVGAEAHQEKYTSAVGAIMRARAESKGHSTNLVMAMVDKELEVKEVKVDGRRTFLTPVEINDLVQQGKSVEIIKTVIEKGKLLTLTAREAKEYGLCSAIMEKLEEIPPLYRITNPIFKEASSTWSEDLVMFLTNPLVAAILMMVGMLAVGISLYAPGFGVPEGLAITCFLIIFFGNYLVGLAEAIEIVLFILGILLLTVELFVLPGFGVAGIGGIILILVSLVLSMQNFTLPDPQIAPWQVEILQKNVLIVAGSFFAALVTFLLLLKFLPNTPFLSRLVLRTEEQTQSGFTITLPEQETFIGQKGTALTTLRPSGKIKIGEKLLDAVADGEFVEKNETVEVIRTEGTHLVVTKHFRLIGGQDTKPPDKI
ncbi:MAG: NfeD family protein [Planctomycetota bacterium]